MRELPVGQVSVATEPERNWFCRYCGTIITADSERVERGGDFRHAFTNPGGNVFGIGCFADAPGCVVVGKRTREHTWFHGYDWCYALCSGCASHLGWHYRGRRRDTFFGLILDRLIEP